MKVPSQLAILSIISLFLVSCIGQGQPVLPLHSEPLGTDWGRQYRMGELLLDDRCFQLQADEELLRRVKVVQPLPILPVWPEGFTWAKTKKTLEIINESGEKVAQVGDRVRLSGAEVIPESHQGKQIAGSLPAACIGIYYLVGDDITVIEDDEPEIIPVPDTDIHFKRRKTQYLGFTPTEEPAYAYSRTPSTLTLEDGCIVLVDPDGEKYVPEWPAGFTPHLENGVLEVRNGGGRTIGRVGARLRTRGYIARESEGGLYVPECRPRLLVVWGVINTDLPLTFLKHGDRWKPEAEQTNDSIEGEIDVRNGCMHINNNFLLWPSDYSVEEEEGSFRVLDAVGRVVAESGEEITLKGHRIRSDDKFGPEIIRMMPTDCPPWTYWIVTGHKVEPDANQAGLMQLRAQHPASQIQTAPGLSAPATSVPEQAKPAVVYDALYFTANMLEESSADASDELSKLVEHSSIIVVGTVSNSQADVVRSPHEGVNNNNVGVANVYGFEVDRYLKGSGLDTISVIQFIGVDVTTAQGETIQARDKLDNLLLGRGSRYLLFLTEQDDSNDYWIGTAEPYKFLLSDGLAKVESPVEGMEELFSDQAEFVFVNSVEGKIASSP